MKEYQQKYIVRKLLYSKVTIVVLFLLTVLLARSVVELNNKRIDTNKLTKESETERKDLEQKVQKAEEKNNEINTPRGFEAYVRTTFPVVKEGEGVIVVYDDDKNPVAQVKEGTTFLEKISLFFQSWGKK